PGQHICVLTVLNRCFIGHIDRFRDRTRNEWLSRSHHANVAFNRKITLTDLTAWIGAIEHSVMLFLKERRTFQCHSTANMNIGCINILTRKSERWQHFKRKIVELLIRELQNFFAEIFAQRPFIEGELDIKSTLESSIQRFNFLISKALSLQRSRIDTRSLIEVAVTNRIGLNFSNLAFRIAQCAQGFRYGTINDLKIPTTGKFFKLH